MDIQTKAQRDKLLSSANVARMRGDFESMEKACQEIIALTGEDADIIELLADSLFGQERYAEAKEAYKKATELAPGKESLENKYAKAVLKASEQQLQIESTLRKIEIKPEVPNHKLVAGAGCLSMLFPGLGQLISGQYIKGGIILACFLISLIALSLLRDTETFVKSLGMAFGLTTRQYGEAPPELRIGIWFVLFSGIAAFCYVYSVIDAFVEGAKELAAKKTSAKES